MVDTLVAGWYDYPSTETKGSLAMMYYDWAHDGTMTPFDQVAEGLSELWIDLVDELDGGEDDD